MFIYLFIYLLHLPSLKASRTLQLEAKAVELVGSVRPSMFTFFFPLHVYRSDQLLTWSLLARS